EGVLMYRNDLLEHSGWDKPPQTREELQEDGKALTEGGRWGFVWPLSRKDSAANVKIFQTLYGSKGGSFFDDEGKAAVNSRIGVEIAEKLVALARDSQIMPATAVGVEEGRTMMKSGATAMYVDGTQVFTTIASGKDLGDNLSSAPLPRLDEGGDQPSAIVAGQTLAISS